MTLQEHAKRIWDRQPSLMRQSFEWLSAEDKIPHCEAAYDELRKESEAAKSAINEKMFNALQRIQVSMGLDPRTPFSGVADKAVEAIGRTATPVSPSMERIAVALGMDPCTLWDKVADRAIAELTRLREIETSQTNKVKSGLDQLSRVYFWAAEKKVGQMQSLSPELMADFIIGKLKEAAPAQTAAEPPQKAVYEWEVPPEHWRGVALHKNRIKVGEVKQTQRLPLCYWWEVNISTTKIGGRSESFDLAKAAVEAIVRAHYGDEA